MLNAVIRDVTDRTSGEGRYLWYFDISVGGELFLEDGSRVAFDDFVGTRLDDLERV